MNVYVFLAFRCVGNGLHLAVRVLSPLSFFSLPSCYHVYHGSFQANNNTTRTVLRTRKNVNIIYSCSVATWICRRLSVCPRTTDLGDLVKSSFVSINVSVLGFKVYCTRKQTMDDDKDKSPEDNIPLADDDPQGTS